MSTNGTENDDFTGPMMPSPRLDKTPYIRQVMSSFNAIIGRSRLMRLTPGASVDPHSDMHYFWRNHLRIHVPILTEPEVIFYCADEEVHMAAGEAWTFDNWLYHSVRAMTWDRAAVDSCKPIACPSRSTHVSPLVK